MRYTQNSHGKFGRLELMFYVCLCNRYRMKRVIYISLVFVGLLAVSCSKQNVQPNTDTPQEIPTWRTSSDDANSNDGGTFVTGEGGITDPNNDKDESGRRKN